MDELRFQEPQQPRSDAAKNHQLLLATARRLFDQHGVEQVTMSMIAEAAQVGKGTLYRHFADKSALCFALLDDDQRQLQEQTLQRLRHMPDALDNLLWFISQTVQFSLRNAALLCHSTKVTDSLQSPAHWWWRQTLHALLTQLHPQHDQNLLADHLYTLLDVHVIYFLHTQRGHSVDHIQNHLFALIREFAPV